MKKFFLHGSLFLTLTLLMALPALAGHYPDKGDMYRIEELAEDLKKSTRYLYKDARHYADRHDYNEAHALRQLRNFREKAEEFECAIEENYGDPYRTEEYFHDLYYAAKVAEDTFRDLPHHDHLYNNYYEIKSLMSQLSRYYGYPNKAYGKRHGGKYRKWGKYRRGVSLQIEDRPYGKPEVSFRIEW